jgi:AcrR family transcriptional regulator
MPRWEPDARQRLVTAALRLFSEQGYDNTTVAQIADSAGLTRSTFFRHFPDKREVLAAGQEVLAELFTTGIAAAPEDATALDAVEHGLTTAGAAMTPFNRELAPRMQAVVASSAELRERDQLKHVGLAASMAEALRARGVSQAVAALAGDIGVLAFNEAYAEWVREGDEGDKSDEGDLVGLLRAAMSRLRSAVAELG